MNVAKARCFSRQSAKELSTYREELTHRSESRIGHTRQVRLYLSLPVENPTRHNQRESPCQTFAQQDKEVPHKPPQQPECISDKPSRQPEQQYYYHYYRKQVYQQQQFKHTRLLF